MQHLISTETLVSQIPARAMLDLEPIGGEGFSASYGTLVDVSADHMVALHDGTMYSIPVSAETTIPVITYGLSNVLEPHPL